MAALTITEVIELKTIIEKQFNTKIHFHDCCGGQHFSADAFSSDMKNYICDYFDKKGLSAEFSDDMRMFFVKEAPSC